MKKKTYIIKRTVIEQYSVEAYSRKEALKIPLEDPSIITVIKETIKPVKENAVTPNNI